MTFDTTRIPWIDRQLTIGIRHEDLERLEEIASYYRKSPAMLASDFIIYCIDRIEIQRGKERKRVEEGRKPTSTPEQRAAYAATREAQLRFRRAQDKARREQRRADGRCCMCGRKKEPHRMDTVRCEACKGKR